jgi:murein DD-endopeptidase MepM/ murein hydrolase activator NlpD
MKRFLIIFLVILLLPIVSFAQSDVSILESEKRTLQSELAELEAKIDGYENELDKRQDEITSLKNQIYIINTRINKLDVEIRRTQNQISTTRINIQQTQVSIDRAISTIEKKKATLAELLRSMYILDNESLVERMLKYDSLSEVLSETQYISEVQERLTSILDETRSEKKGLEQHEIVLKDNKNELEQKEDQLAIQKNAQKSEKNYQDSILKETKEEEKAFQELLSEAEQEQAEFMKRLAVIEEQILIQQNFISYFKAGEIPKKGTKIFIWPEDNQRVTQSYGMTTYARRGAYGGKGHNGIDMASGIGTPIKAAAGGNVIAKGAESCKDYIRRSCNGYWGNWVAIEHPGGLVTLYTHLTKPSHKQMGDSVQASEIIGYEGATGSVTGPHLHFSVYTEFFTYKDGDTVRFSYNYNKTLNPLDYL